MLEEYRHIPMVVMDGVKKLTSPMRSLITRSKAATWPALSDLNAVTAKSALSPGPLERNTGAGRLAGFMKAMEEAMIKVPESWIVQARF